MRSTRTIDISTGLFVMLGFAAILFMVTQITNRGFSLKSDSYRLTASFENIGGLKPGAPVSMAGVTIGRVEDIQYDINLYKAIVTMRISDPRWLVRLALRLGAAAQVVEPTGLRDEVRRTAATALSLYDA